MEFLHHHSECVLLPRFNYDDTCLSEAKPGRVIYSKKRAKSDGHRRKKCRAVEKGSDASTSAGQGWSLIQIHTLESH